MTHDIEDDGDITVHPPIRPRPAISRATLTGQILDRMARDLAEDIVKHRLTEREAHCIAANLAEEAIHYAAKLEQEAARAETLAATREASLAKASATWLAKQEAGA